MSDILVSQYNCFSECYQKNFLEYNVSLVAFFPLRCWKVRVIYG